MAAGDVAVLETEVVTHAAAATCTWATIRDLFYQSHFVGIALSLLTGMVWTALGTAVHPIMQARPSGAMGLAECSEDADCMVCQVHAAGNRRRGEPEA